MILPLNYFAIFLFGFGLITGFVVSLLVWSKRQTDQSHIDWLEAVFVAFVGLVILVGWSGVLLASFGVFSLNTISVIVLLVVCGVAWWQRPFTFPRFLPLTWYETILLILLFVFAIIYFRPHEFVLGGADAGGYMNIGATLAQTGDFVLHDEWVSYLSSYADVTLREQPAHWQTRYLQFVGWYIDDHDPARIIPQFFPFHPVLIAVGIGLAGLYGGLLVTPLWAVLGLTAVYLLTRQLFDRRVALLATLLLGITPTHIFFARYPTTEPLTLLLIFTGLFAFQKLWDDTNVDPAWGLWGGFAIGAALLTRIDLPLVAILVLIALGICRWQRHWSKGWTAFTLSFGLLLIHAIISALFLNWPYTWNTYSSILRSLSRSSLVVGISLLSVLAVSGVFAIWRLGWLRGNDFRRIINSPKTRWILALLVIILSLYAYFLRPVLEPIRYYNSWPAGNQVPLLDGQNWLRLGWYLTPLGLVLATTGLAWIIVTQSWFRYGLFLSVGVLTIVQYVYRIFNTPYHIYAMRRYVPIVIPMLMIYAAVAILAVFRARRFKAARVTGILLALILIAGLLYQARFVLPQQDFKGVIAQLTALNAQLDPNAIVVINESTESDFADRFGTPLRFIFGHDIAIIRGEGEEIRPFFNDLIAQATEQKRPLQLLAVESIDNALRENATLQPVTMIPFALQMLMNTFDEFPSVVQTAYYGIEIYDIVSDTLPLDETDLEIDIGTLDAAYIEDGFYYKEPLLEGPTMRWTTGEATVSWPSSTDNTSLTIAVRAMIYRPEGVPETAVIVSLDDQEIGRFTPSDAWQTYTFPAPISSSKQLHSKLHFKSETFIPAELQLNNDLRELGFLIDWIKITDGP